jgi:hypothetical protein
MVEIRGATFGTLRCEHLCSKAMAISPGQASYMSLQGRRKFNEIFVVISVLRHNGVFSVYYDKQHFER